MATLTHGAGRGPGGEEAGGLPLAAAILRVAMMPFIDATQRRGKIFRPRKKNR